MDFYLQDQNGRQLGPYSLTQLRSFWLNGQLVRTSPYWSPGMPEWRPISSLEAVLKPPPAPPTHFALSSAATVPQKRPWGCFRVLGLGCLGSLGLVFFLVVLLVALAPPESPAQKQERAVEDASSRQGFQAGLAQAKLSYVAGYPAPSDEMCAGYARQLLASDEYKDFHGFESGYQLGWNEAKNDYVNGR